MVFLTYPWSKVYSRHQFGSGLLMFGSYRAYFFPTLQHPEWSGIAASQEEDPQCKYKISSSLHSSCIIHIFHLFSFVECGDDGATGSNHCGFLCMLEPLSYPYSCDAVQTKNLNPRERWFHSSGLTYGILESNLGPLGLHLTEESSAY